MAGDSLMGPPSIFHRSLHVNEETGGWHIDMHTDPAQCAEAYCPKGWLLAYPGNSPADYVDIDTGALGTYADHVDWMERRALRRHRASEESRGISPGEMGPQLSGVTAAPMPDAVEASGGAQASRRAAGPLSSGVQLNVKYRGFTMFRCDECGEDYLSIESARNCRDSHTRGRVGSISGGTPLAAPQGDAGSSPAASTVRPLAYSCGVCEDGAFGANCLTCGRGMPTA